MYQEKNLRHRQDNNGDSSNKYPVVMQVLQKEEKTSMNRFNRIIVKVLNRNKERPIEVVKNKK